MPQVSHRCIFCEKLIYEVYTRHGELVWNLVWPSGRGNTLVCEKRNGKPHDPHIDAWYQEYGFPLYD